MRLTGKCEADIPGTKKPILGGSLRAISWGGGQEPSNCGHFYTFYENSNQNQEPFPGLQNTQWRLSTSRLRPALLWPSQGLLASTCLSSLPTSRAGLLALPKHASNIPVSAPSLPPGCSSSVPVLLRARRRAQRCRRLTPETRGSPQRNQGVTHSLKATRRPRRPGTSLLGTRPQLLPWHSSLPLD